MRSPLRLSHRVPILLPVALAFTLVAATVVQAVRTTQLHRRAVDAAVRDYASFAVWQYSRRASDYLRLTILNSIHNAGQQTAVSCRLDSAVTITHNVTGVPDAIISLALASAAEHAERSHLTSGMVSLPHGFLGYVLRSTDRSPRTCEAVVVDSSDLAAVFRHVATFSPLLPPSFVDSLPNDSLVTIELRDQTMRPLITLGPANVAGRVRATDHLGPDLGDVQVVATLHAPAIRRLVAGGIPPSNTAALTLMLVVTLMLCVVAVQQVRRTNEISRLRSDFVASVSHELKTPLTQISLFAETLAKRDRPFEERLQYLGIIRREATRLGQLVDRIVHFAGLSRAAAHVDVREDCDVNEEIREAIGALASIAAAQNTTMRFIEHARLRAALDRDAFRQLMLNLLDNAVKFGPNGQRVDVTIAADGPSGIIDVDDEGPGVSDRDRNNVFEPFVRGTNAGVPGSGIGLAVVRDIAAQHGGSVVILRSPSGGARFRVRLHGARRTAVVETLEPAS